MYYVLLLLITLMISFSISFFSFSPRENLSLAASNQQIINTDNKDIILESKNSVQASEDINNKANTEINPSTVESNMDLKKELKPDIQKANKKPSEEIKQEKDNGKEEKPKVENSTNEKIAYLTFDDGPSQNITPQILDILKNNNVKATFFVIGSMVEKNPDLMKRARAEGHAIANHTYSHDFNQVYSNPQNLLNDIIIGEDVIKKFMPDYSSKVIRFPGGSFGTKRKPFKDFMQSQGFKIVDWNCVNGDAEALNVPPDKLLNRVKETYGNQKQLTVLMHDAPSKDTTVQALPQIIQFLQSQGYIFKTID
jgi:peptidoglycan-N-acetylglucosamine deacetylase